jgi:hypothetical protein
MNNNASGYMRRLARATIAVSIFVSVSAVFISASAQEDYYGDDEVIFDNDAPTQPEAPAAAPPAQYAPAAPDEPAATPVPAPAVAIPDGGTQTPSGEDVSNDEQPATTGTGDKRAAADKAGGKSAPTPLFSRPHFELGLGMTTVDGKSWPYIALGADIPIWKFGVFLDFELFLNNNWKVSDRGWDFKDNSSEALLRKIRHIRYGHEDEPLFVKFGGLSNVTLGYGMIVDRFTNMLRYPGEKLLGLQVYVNDVSPIGLTAQALISDFAELGDKSGRGGLYAARLAARPLKMSEIFLLDRVSVGGMYAIDANVHAPAHKWPVNDEVAKLKYTRDKEPWHFDSLKSVYEDNHMGVDADTVLSRLDAEDSLRNNRRSFALYGFDVGLPIVKTELLGVDLYGQSAFRTDGVSGWGIGVPGVAVRLWKLFGNVEYRMVGGRFTPGFGYFDTYYLDERYPHDNIMNSKDESLLSVSQKGVLGRLGADLFGVLSLSGTYQYMAGKYEDGSPAVNRYYEATVGLGEAVMNFVPIFDIAEAYIRNADIGAYYKYKKDGSPDIENNVHKKAKSFDRSPGMYLGYRAGIKLVSDLSLIWDYRYGWKVEDGKLVSDNHIRLHAAMGF